MSELLAFIRIAMVTSGLRTVSKRTFQRYFPLLNALQRQITITRKQFPQDGYEYDLVCGQGRLEAYIANNQKTIPAIVVEASEEDALIMSLVENIARKNYQPFELFKNVKKLHDYGYSAEAIAPFKAAILPPPGTGSLPATLFKNSFTVKSTNMILNIKD